jgi:hypothetical protein
VSQRVESQFQFQSELCIELNLLADLSRLIVTAALVGLGGGEHRAAAALLPVHGRAAPPRSGAADPVRRGHGTRSCHVRELRQALLLYNTTKAEHRRSFCTTDCPVEHQVSATRQPHCTSCVYCVTYVSRGCFNVSVV